MSFLVYLFVLLVAAGSVIFGLDWTQAPLNPPPYATLPAQTAAAKAAPVPVAKAKALPASASPQPAATNAIADEATGALASATHEDSANTDSAAAAEPQPAAAHCNIQACSAAYRSFRATDCTYQPFNGERRLCTKSGAGGRVAAATHPRSIPRSEDRRLTDRRDYRDDRRGGDWGFGFFGNGGDDYR